ncbi:hypothetical protein Lal_00021165 [Lupinus albus]|uniref:Putative small auxin-up RNA n=1 Tax=Lupinus albus TaxID=3870 RepID=A0A6A4QA04_LUPAL|nr:putative small auxin-up RNA [Lupinus albus]KAF1876606.1 hypothetical protein Lal_00021165 [Lupinus albus]
MQFKLKKRVTRVTRWIFLRFFSTRPGYRRMGCSSRKPMTKKLLSLGRKLTLRARSLCSYAKFGSRYKPIGSDPVQDTVPKGHLAVYVGQKDGDGEFCRVLVPVIYFNHPLFGELLNKAEKVYGFEHQGGITIPCRVAEFERVKTRIESGFGDNSGCRRLVLRWFGK